MYLMRVRPAFVGSLLSCDTTNNWNFYFILIFNQLDIRQETMGVEKEQEMAYSQGVIAGYAD